VGGPLAQERFEPPNLDESLVDCGNYGKDEPATGAE
jgi:hypothetical protein